MKYEHQCERSDSLGARMRRRQREKWCYACGYEAALSRAVSKAEIEATVSRFVYYGAISRKMVCENKPGLIEAIHSLQLQRPGLEREQIAKIVHRCWHGEVCGCHCAKAYVEADVIMKVADA